MRVEQVQNERDVMGKRVRTTSMCTATKPLRIKRHRNGYEGSSMRLSSETAGSPENAWDRPDTVIDALLRAEKTMNNQRDSVLKQTGDFECTINPEEPQPSASDMRMATLNDIFESLHCQLLLVVEWAKTLPPFLALSSEYQTALLKNFAAEHVVLCVSYRSKEVSDFLKLINNSIIPRPSKNEQHRKKVLPGVQIIVESKIVLGFALFHVIPVDGSFEKFPTSNCK
ncbi:hypothetical protein KIN20_014135, partial [Parelaphostrongylus tenuis]